MFRLRNFRFLLVICSLTALAGLWELTDPAREGESSSVISLKFSEEFAQLYPRHENTLHAWARALAERDDLQGARASLEEAITTGAKSNEPVYYDYVVVLVRLNADPAAIGKAVVEWRRNFPHSGAPDPTAGSFYPAPKRRP